MSKPINFPTVMNIGMQHTVGDRTWEWDGSGWKNVDVNSTDPSYTESKSPPTSPNDGDRWKNTSTEITFTYLESEGTWVEL